MLLCLRSLLTAKGTVPEISVEPASQRIVRAVYPAIRESERNLEWTLTRSLFVDFLVLRVVAGNVHILNRLNPAGTTHFGHACSANSAALLSSSLVAPPATCTAIPCVRIT